MCLATTYNTSCACQTTTVLFCPLATSDPDFIIPPSRLARQTPFAAYLPPDDDPSVLLPPLEPTFPNEHDFSRPRRTSNNPLHILKIHNESFDHQESSRPRRHSHNPLHLLHTQKPEEQNPSQPRRHSLTHSLHSLNPLHSSIQHHNHTHKIHKPHVILDPVRDLRPRTPPTKGSILGVPSDYDATKCPNYRAVTCLKPLKEKCRESSLWGGFCASAS